MSLPFLTSEYLKEKAIKEGANSAEDHLVTSRFHCDTRHQRAQFRETCARMLEMLNGTEHCIHSGSYVDFVTAVSGSFLW